MNMLQSRPTPQERGQQIIYANASVAEFTLHEFQLKPVVVQNNQF